MRLNSYIFPKETSEKDLFMNNMNFETRTFTDEFGNEWNGECNAKNCCKRFRSEGYFPKDQYDFTEEDYEKAYQLCVEKNIIKSFTENKIGGVSVTFVKLMIKKYGGTGITYHIDRDGGIFETSEIRLKGNNSRHKYNQHL